MKPRIAPLTAVGLLVLAGLDAWLLTVVTADRAPEALTAALRTEPSLGLPDSAGAVANSKPIMAYGQTLDRPAFHKTRQPFVPPPPPPPPTPRVVAPPPPTVAVPSLVLGGIAITADAKKAYLVNKANSQGTWLSEGESIMGWTLRSISATSAKLHQADRTIELELYPSR